MTQPASARAEAAMAPNRFLDGALAELRRGGLRPAAWGEFWAALRERAAESRRDRPDLVRHLRRGALVAILAAAALSALMLLTGELPAAAAALPVLAAILLWRWMEAELGLLRHPLSDRPSPAFGAANLLSLYRGWAAVPVLLLGLLRRGPDAVWLGLAVTAGLTDLVDGTVATRLGQESRLGRLLDPLMDALLFTATAAGLARWGLLPAWLAALIGLRYFLPLLGGLALMLALGHTLPLRHTAWGQRSTLAVGVALLLTWGRSLLPVPLWLTTGWYVLTLATMVLALGGIARRAPRGGAAPELQADPTRAQPHRV